ncbi:MAG: energy-coupled thiamine transporter ThiT [Velocimicrobium sp.]
MKELLFKTVDGEFSFTTAGYITFIVLIALLIIAAVLLTKKTPNRREEKKFDTKQLVFCAVSIALAMITSMFPIYSFPFGGSVTLFSMFFICFIGYLYGPSAGLCTGLAYGILQLVIKPYIYFPAQVLVDYPLAFGALGLSGFFWKSKYGLIKGYVTGVLGRYFFAVLSGWIFFGEYAWDGWAALPYSLAYNGAYIFTEAAVTIFLLFCIKPLSNGLNYIKKLSME